jgi:hypothetical protein
METKPFLLIFYQTSKFSIFIDSRYSVQQIVFGDSHFVEKHESIINSVQTSFWTTITDHHSWQELVGLRVSDWNNESVNSVTFFLNVKLGPNHAH